MAEMKNKHLGADLISGVDCQRMPTMQKHRTQQPVRSWTLIHIYPLTVSWLGQRRSGWQTVGVGILETDLSLCCTLGV